MADPEGISGKEAAQLQGQAKMRYVGRMFGRIAGAYDRLNTVISLGQDRRWRRMTVRLASPSPATLTLDLACGTGEMALEVARQDGRVVGLDLSPEMLARARAKAARQGYDIPFLLGDALCLPFRSESFDSAVAGFALRNVADLPRFFAEAHRVLRPGGRLLCLEITHPPKSLVGLLARLYFRHLTPLVGGILSGNRQAYAYLPHSLDPFPDAAALKAMMQDAGFREVAFRRLGFGIMALHRGVKG